jgi:energy-coupling factor transporter transmembrane protein EcfT
VSLHPSLFFYSFLLLSFFFLLNLQILSLSFPSFLLCFLLFCGVTILPWIFIVSLKKSALCYLPFPLFLFFSFSSISLSPSLRDLLILNFVEEVEEFDKLEGNAQVKNPTFTEQNAEENGLSSQTSNGGNENSENSSMIVQNKK